jgi:hypothetical protein
MEAMVLFIELHVPISSIQKLKLMKRGGQFTYISSLIFNTLPHVEAPSGLRRGIEASNNYFYLIALIRI